MATIFAKIIDNMIKNEQQPQTLQTSVQKPSEIQPGIVSIGNHYTEIGEMNIHLISNYWGLDTFMEAPLPERELSLVFISTASKPYPEHGQPVRFLDAERAWLDRKQKEGRIKYNEYCLTGQKPDQIEEALQDIDVIFMGGGNTQYLLEQIQKSGAGPIIQDRVREGVWYFGKSAGAIIAGPDINPRGFFLESMATEPLEDTKGLGLTQIYPLPHIDTPSIMSTVYEGKTGWQHAVEMTRLYPTAYILDNSQKK